MSLLVAALNGGTLASVLGFLLQLMMSVVISAIYRLASLRLPVLAKMSIGPGSLIQALTSLFITSNKMTMKHHKRSPIGLAILALLTEAPMHPYRMQQLIKARGKDQVINVRLRATLYQTIDRLQREGLIASGQIEKMRGKPDRTVYTITPSGREVSIDWLRGMLSDADNEFPEFPVAISFLGLITPEETATWLEARLSVLAARQAALAAELKTYSVTLPRVFLLENEYQLAVMDAECQWVSQIIADIRSGTLDWGEATREAVAHLLETAPSAAPG